MIEGPDKRETLGRFTGLAALYSKHRPSYPDEAITFILVRSALMPSSLIVDIGSGTGISSRLFAARGFQVIGVEPNDDMRKAALENARDYPSLTYVAGTAEATGLDGDLADLIVCAQSFHWFEPDAALNEFQRIVKRGGWVALMWNEREESDAFTLAYGDLLRTLPGTASVEMHRGVAGKVLLQTALFDKADLTTFGNEQVVDEEGLLGRAFSTSYAPKDKDEVAQFTEQLKTLFAQHQQNGTVSLCYTTSVYSAQRRP